MLIKVELHPDVVWFVRHRCNVEEQGEFYRMLERVRAEPTSNSEAYSDLRLSPYMLRRFRFKSWFAVFHYDIARNRIRITECQRQLPKRGRREDE